MPPIAPILLLGLGIWLIAATSKKKTTAPATPAPAPTPGVPIPVPVPPPTGDTSTPESVLETGLASNDPDQIARYRDWQNEHGKSSYAAQLQKHLDDVLDGTFQTAINLTDVPQIKYAQAYLQKYGHSSQAAQLQTRIDELLARGAPPVTTSPPATPVVPTPVLPAPGPVPVTPPLPEPGAPVIVVPAPAPVTPPPVIVPPVVPPPAATPPTAPEPVLGKAPPPALQKQETAPIADPNGTILLAQKMLDAERKNGWKTALASDIKAWQARVGLTADGKFGPGSAKKMAEEVGALPLVRYWPASAQKNTAVPAYKNDLTAIQERLTNQGLIAHSGVLGLAAEREKGQAFGTTTGAAQKDVDDYANNVAMLLKVAAGTP